jgi:phenylacetic acid degradation operon negative regulatory protein
MISSFPWIRDSFPMLSTSSPKLAAQLLADATPEDRKEVERWIRHHLEHEEPRSKSLIVTILGDSIVACGSAVWLGDLIGLLQPFGVNERLVRTSISRLAEEGWIEARREGRRSRYALTPSGTSRFEHAFQRIYTPPPQDWDGTWTQLVLLRGASGADDRAELRRELLWEGFGLLAPGIFLHPAANRPALEEILDRLQLRERTVILQALGGSAAAGQASALVQQCWNLADCAQEYRGFLKAFEPLLTILESRQQGDAAISPGQAFVVQTLLVHAFRRVSLHDPRLPAPMLPPDWPGHAAYRLCQHLYALTAPASWRYLLAALEETTGPAGLRMLQTRFGLAG